jgi:hypothetical protein
MRHHPAGGYPAATAICAIITGVPPFTGSKLGHVRLFGNREIVRELQHAADQTLQRRRVRIGVMAILPEALGQGDAEVPASLLRIPATTSGGRSAEPPSLALAVTIVTACPWLRSRARVPAARISMSSGCACMARMGLTASPCTRGPTRRGQWFGADLVCPFPRRWSRKNRSHATGCSNRAGAPVTEWKIVSRLSPFEFYILRLNLAAADALKRSQRGTRCRQETLNSSPGIARAAHCT